MSPVLLVTKMYAMMTEIRGEGKRVSDLILRWTQANQKGQTGGAVVFGLGGPKGWGASASLCADCTPCQLPMPCQLPTTVFKTGVSSPVFSAALLRSPSLLSRQTRGGEKVFQVFRVNDNDGRAGASFWSTCIAADGCPCVCWAEGQHREERCRRLSVQPR